jgi:DNA-binding protein HU-beta
VLFHFEVYNIDGLEGAPMTKSELIKQVAESTGITQTKVRAVLEAVMSPKAGIVASCLRKGEKVTLTGFGTFSPRIRASRVGRNPITGEAVKVPKRKYPAFKAAKKLKEALKK